MPGHLRRWRPASGSRGRRWIDSPGPEDEEAFAAEVIRLADPEERARSGVRRALSNALTLFDRKE